MWKKLWKKKNNIGISILMLTLMASLTGCGSNKTEDNNQGIVTPEKIEVDNSTEPESETEVEADETEEGLANWEPGQKIQSNGKQLFLLSNRKLLSVDIESRSTNVLYESEQKDGDYGYYDSFCLYQNWVYFITDYTPGSESCSMWRIDQNGENLVKVVDGLVPWTYTMVAVDDVLYLEKDESLTYQIGEDGSLTECDPAETVLASIPEGYACIYANMGDNSGSYLPAVTKAWNGNAFLRNEDGTTICLNMETGEETTLDLPENSSVCAMTKEYLIIQEYDEGYRSSKYWIKDLNTMEMTELCDNTYTLVGCSESEAYLMQTEKKETGNHFTYTAVNLQNGESRELFAIDSVPGMYEETMSGVRNLSVIGNQLYYVYGEQGKTSLYTKNTTDQNQGEVLLEGLTDEGWSELGTMQAEQGESYYEDILISDAYVEWFVLNGDTPAVQKINATLKNAADADISYGKDLGNDWDAEYIKEEFFIPGGYSSTFTGITYRDDNYLCMGMSSYDFQGGAHGMPGRVYYLFDLNTGDQLQLSDVVGNTEEELNQIIVDAFTEYSTDPDSGLFPEGLDSVKNSAGFDSNFYLTEEGLCIYYYPYDIAPYAAGFPEVTIPYDKLDMKIF
ncbi:MAG: DUF3298 domain-containing protein [Lachnospiraceae bacterium]|nr:DUF3298 domain-containing protein [Lachnospiraceae bacterium]